MLNQKVKKLIGLNALTENVSDHNDFQRRRPCVNHSHRVTLGHCPSKALQTSAPEPQASGGHNNTACPTVRQQHVDDQLQMSHPDFNPMGSTESLHHSINETPRYVSLTSTAAKVQQHRLLSITLLFFFSFDNVNTVLAFCMYVKIYTKLWQAINEEHEWELWHICGPMLVWYMFWESNSHRYADYPSFRRKLPKCIKW